MSTPLRERPDAPLGTLIFRAGLLPAETIESALEEGVKTGKRLGEILTERGLISEVDLARLLAGQKGLEFVTLREQIVDPSAAGLFTEERARLFRALPYTFEDEIPVVAIADPTDEVLLRNIREALGREDVRFVVSARGELVEISTGVYSKPLETSAPASPEADPEPVVKAAPEPMVEVAPEPVVDPAAEVAPDAVIEPEPVIEATTEPEAGWPQVESEPEAEAGWPQVEPEPEPEAGWPQVEPKAEPEPAPLLQEPVPAPEVHAVEHTNGVVPPEAAPLLQAPEPVLLSVPEPEAAEPEQPFLETPAPEQHAAAEPPAAEPVTVAEPTPLSEPLPAYEPVPAPEPEPAPEPAAVQSAPEAPAAQEHLGVSDPAPTPEPAPAPEPVASPEPVPMPDPTPPPAPYPPAAAQPEPAHAPAAPEPSVPEPAIAEASAGLWSVTIRLTNGDRVEAGEFEDAEAAKQHAKSIMTQVGDADQGDWPFVSSRFLKPETIVSVDIAEHDGDSPAAS